MPARFTVIYADPPWRYQSRHYGFGGAEVHYATLSHADICALPVPAAADCVLLMWATMPLLPEALAVMAAWGFTYRTVAFCWVKLNPSGVGLAMGLGSWTRANAELCLLGVRGRPKPISHRVHSVVLAPRRRQSEKPAEVRHRIVELMGKVHRLELFARTHEPGWAVWGNEVRSTASLAAPRPTGPRRPRARHKGAS